MQVMFSAAQIAERVESLAAEVARALPTAARQDGLLVVVTLRGAAVFAADLVRALSRAGQPSVIDFWRLSSYGAGTESSGTVRLDQDLELDVGGRHVLLVDDIIDTGRTVAFARALLRGRGPASLTTVCFLDKPTRRAVEAEADHVGFTIPDRFVVGYGTDLDQRYRELPYVGVYSGG